MTTNNHPAHGPVSLDRLHQIREILSKAAAQSDGGNIGYAMADAVKVIGEVLGRRQADNLPVHPTIADEKLDDETLQELIEFRRSTFEYHSKEGHKVQTIIHGVVLSALLELQERRAAMLQAGNSPVTPDCSCRTCRPVTFTDSRFVVCHECGNKRCPHANDHRNACTGSNEPGQVGSAYPAAPQQEVK
ncbi:hypothetical protein [Citrobacter sp. RHBSTW-00524]|uniref:hypothetical protein n=1 Tax=Citrobacter sp. RHBSTW-00524 TaxID=2742653 RepID=UPI0015E919B3|nr:hypothetical protein [Citrobacter sp. RHBSTW-00524]QLW41613.1 hypothetical protein HV229_14610 [Citrobacter sp. RHBSTW-00524]